MSHFLLLPSKHKNERQHASRDKGYERKNRREGCPKEHNKDKVNKKVRFNWGKKGHANSLFFLTIRLRGYMDT